jgi:hypothetical protein
MRLTSSVRHFTNFTRAERVVVAAYSKIIIWQSVINKTPLHRQGVFESVGIAKDIALGVLAQSLAWFD